MKILRTIPEVRSAVCDARAAGLWDVRLENPALVIGDTEVSVH